MWQVVFKLFRKASTNPSPNLSLIRGFETNLLALNRDEKKVLWVQILSKHAFYFLSVVWRGKSENPMTGGVCGEVWLWPKRPAWCPHTFVVCYPWGWYFFKRYHALKSQQWVIYEFRDLVKSVHKRMRTRWHSGDINRWKHQPQMATLTVHNNTLYLFDCLPQLTAAHTPPLAAARVVTEACINSRRLTISGVELWI